MALLPDTLQAGDVHLRRWDPACADALAAAIVTSFSELQLWMAWAQSRPVTHEVRGALRRGHAAFDADRDWDYTLHEVDSDELVGGAGLHRHVRPDPPEIGYWVRSDRTGRGYATAAARALAEAAFAYLDDVDRIMICMDVANAASAAIPPKLGFHLLRQEDRAIVAKGHTGRGFVWVLDRQPSERDKKGRDPNRQSAEISQSPIPH
jgi:ribosomal-protein-serine acetyltransferase